MKFIKSLLIVFSLLFATTAAAQVIVPVHSGDVSATYATVGGTTQTITNWFYNLPKTVNSGGNFLMYDQTGTYQAASIDPIPYAVNIIHLQPGITTNGPVLRCAGSDTNVDCNYFSQGHGLHAFTNGYGWNASIEDDASVNPITDHLRLLGGASATPSIPTINSTTDVALDSASGHTTWIKSNGIAGLSIQNAKNLSSTTNYFNIIPSTGAAVFQTAGPNPSTTAVNGLFQAQFTGNWTYANAAGNIVTYSAGYNGSNPATAAFSLIANQANSPAKMTCIDTTVPSCGIQLSGSGTVPYVQISSPLRVSISATLTAAGTTQGTATAIVSDLSILTTVASGTGVVLQSNLGEAQRIFNRGANALLVYPPTSAQIEAYGINTAVQITAGNSATFICATTTQCYEAP